MKNIFQISEKYNFWGRVVFAIAQFLIIQDPRGAIGIFGDQLSSACRNTRHLSQNCIYPWTWLNKGKLRQLGFIFL